MASGSNGGGAGARGGRTAGRGRSTAAKQRGSTQKAAPAGRNGFYNRDGSFTDTPF